MRYRATRNGGNGPWLITGPGIWASIKCDTEESAKTLIDYLQLAYNAGEQAAQVRMRVALGLH